MLVQPPASNITPPQQACMVQLSVLLLASCKPLSGHEQMAQARSMIQFLGSEAEICRQQLILRFSNLLHMLTEPADSMELSQRQQRAAAAAEKPGLPSKLAGARTPCSRDLKPVTDSAPL